MLATSFASIDAKSAERSLPATVLLGGGGARGLAHLGAMRAIGESGIHVERIIGVSMGALMASLFAVHRNVDMAEAESRRFLNSPACDRLQRQVLGVACDPESETSRPRGNRRGKLRNFMWVQTLLFRAARQPSILPDSVLRCIIDNLLPDVGIEDLSTPLHLLAVDVQTGQRVCLSRGSLREAVRCSMSIPGVFPAVNRGTAQLADLGVYDAVPCDLARQIISQNGAGDGSKTSRLIVVDVGRSTSSFPNCRTAIESVLRFQELAEQQMRDFQLASADLVIRPQFGSTPWFDFSLPDRLIESGYSAATDCFAKIDSRFSCARKPKRVV
ncbi:patatin-like phospholipase family protein [Rubripirellula lacrimiformis]|nr:patatin-like phospholipase family protein [Rubripirellula lacrimiformis]